MNLAMTLFSLMSAWAVVALAFLWGVLRVARRHLGEASVRPKPMRHHKLVLNNGAA